MLYVVNMRPFYSKVSGNKLRMVFAYQNLSIMKDEKRFDFAPIEGKEIIVNTKTKHIENLNETFAFHHGNTYIRMSLERLLLESNLEDFLDPMIDEIIREHRENERIHLENEADYTEEEIFSLIATLEYQNIERLIDKALVEGDKKSFTELVQFKKSFKEKNNLTC